MRRLALCLILASLACGCQSPLSVHMPDDAELDLDPTWFDFEPPWSEDGSPTLPGVPEGGPSPDALRGVPDEIPPDPLADLPPAELPELPPGAGERAPTTVTPEPATPTTPLPGAPTPVASEPRTLPGSVGRPAPPRWDPSRDRTVDRRTWETGRPGSASPGDQAVGTPDAPVDGPGVGEPSDPLLPPGADAPPAGPALPALPDDPVVPSRPEVPTGPVSPRDDDLGFPPGGQPGTPLGPPADRVPPVEPAAPATPTPGPSAPAAPPPTAPSGLDDDPFAPATPVQPDAAPAVPGPGTPARPLGADDDPWSGSGKAVPALPAAPGGEPRPTVPTVPTVPEGPSPGGEDDPFAPGGAGPTPGAPAWRSADPMERAQEQATRLVDDPGNPRLRGYSSDVLMLADAWVALRPGPRPLVVVFYDDSVRTSDLMAAEVLPVLAAHQKDIDIVAIDRGPSAALDAYEKQVVERLLGADDDSVPVLVAQSSERQTLLARFGPFPGEELDRVLRTGQAAPAAPRPADPDPAAPDVAPPDENPFAPSRPTPTAPAPAMPTRPDPVPDAPADDLPPTGMPTNPFGPEPAGPTPRAPEPSVPRGPALPDVPDPLPESAPDAGARKTPVFSVPKAEAALRHAARLRESPTNARLGGYPTSLLSRARPDIALQPGHRPVVIVFYDDTSRASNLQAADVLPALVESAERADIVVIDVAKGAERTEAESRVVKPYYPGSVPAIVVLSAARAPVKLWFQRTSARALRAAVDQAARVK